MANSVLAGRFAPSPTGRLHLGSLVTAVASYCQVKALGGNWYLRIEDTDTQRCKDSYSQSILQDLEALGLLWDGEVTYQSNRSDIYQHYLSENLSGHIYACSCSRKDIANHHLQYSQHQCHQTHQHQSNTQHPIHHSAASRQLTTHSTIYPQICLNKNLAQSQHKLRIHLPDTSLTFYDHLQGPQHQNPQLSLGDMVIRRDKHSQFMINYILAVSIDDGLQGITHVLRGLDIMPMTSAQIHIMQLAGLTPVSYWGHLPLIHNQQGQKLSKQTLATPIDTTQPSILLQQALTLLKQPTVAMDTPSNMLKQAIDQWDDTPLQGTAVLAKINDSHP